MTSESITSRITGRTTRGIADRSADGAHRRSGDHSVPRHGNGTAHRAVLCVSRTVRRRFGRLRRAVDRRRRDAGMSTAEYAVGTIAACAFATVLYKVVTSGPVSEALQQLVEKALDAAV